MQAKAAYRLHARVGAQRDDQVSEKKRKNMGDLEADVNVSAT